mmetsp:Transcript_2788/g.6281  ORF Transcript_2788/g.6281 Transcript_2788/m.6281 type:complete len:310 (+) Transcript_2788:764-1693(+)
MQAAVLAVVVGEVVGRVVCEEATRGHAAGLTLRQRASVDGPVDGLAHEPIRHELAEGVVEDHEMVVRVEGTDVDAVRAPQVVERVDRHVEPDVDAALLDSHRQRVPVGKSPEHEIAPLGRLGVVLVGDQVDVIVLDQEGDGIRPRVHHAAVLVDPVHDKGPLGERGVHHAGGACGLDPHLQGTRHRHSHQAQRRPRGGALPVHLREAGGDVLGVDCGAIRELVRALQRDDPGVFANTTGRLRHLPDDVAMLVDGEELLRDAVARQLPRRALVQSVRRQVLALVRLARTSYRASGACQELQAHHHRVARG